MNWEYNLRLSWQLLPLEFFNTLYMVFFSALFSLCGGLFLGIALVFTQKKGMKEHLFLYKVLSFLVDIGRSIPFAILIIAIFPFTRLVVGTTIGTTAAIVPLTLAAIPFFARLVESALNEVDQGVLDASIVIGAESNQIMWKVLLPEAFPLLIQGATLTIINLIGYSAMAGLVGGGGLGKVAIQYGYQRFNGFLMLMTLILLLLLVAIVQWAGNTLSRVLLKKRGLS